jgi:hypothetical protein
MTFTQALAKYTAHQRDLGITGELPFISKEESKTNDSKDAWLLFDTNGTGLRNDQRGIIKRYTAKIRLKPK